MLIIQVQEVYFNLYLLIIQVQEESKTAQVEIQERLDKEEQKALQAEQKSLQAEQKSLQAEQKSIQAESKLQETNSVSQRIETQKVEVSRVSMI